MKPIALVGRSGRMSLLLQEMLEAQKQKFVIVDRKSKASVLKGVAGLIDFSLPEATENILDLATTAQVPLVCGTTGYSSINETKKIFARASKVIPIVWDANFSLGVEVLNQLASTMAEKIDASMGILDIHHEHKKDAPSGTALRIKDRILEAAPKRKVSIESFRLGTISGEHRILVSFGDEVLELTHRTSSRRPFADGSLRALKWLQSKKSGLYSMRDVLK